MRFHDILGVNERSTNDEIILAYERRVDKVNASLCDNETLREKKLSELMEAKDSCLDWKNKSFTKKSMARFEQTCSDITSKNRLNSFCIGPVTFVDMCLDTCCWGEGGAIGPCQSCCGEPTTDSCCVNCMNGCCETNMTFNPLILVDIALYAVLAFGFFKKVNDKRLADEAVAEAQRKKEDAELATDKENVSNELERLLSKSQNIDIRQAKQIIESKPENPFSRTVAKRGFALDVARRYTANVEKELTRVVSKHDFVSAKEIVDFLTYLHPNSDMYSRIKSALEKLCDFYERKSTYIQSQRYGEIDEKKISIIRNINSQKSSLISRDADYISIAIWHMTLNESFEIARYKAFVNEIRDTFSDNINSIDVAASLMYLKQKNGESFLKNNFDITWRRTLTYITNNYDVEQILSLSSIAAWMNNTEDEKILLSELNRRNRLSGELKFRLEQIQ